MPRFKVVSSRTISTGDETHRTELSVVVLEGQLKVGDTFWAFETHHPFEVTVRAIRHNAGTQHIVECEVAGGLGKYDGFFDSAVIDTSGRKRGVHFFYDHDNRYPPN
jgi:hypothetical protein